MKLAEAIKIANVLRAELSLFAVNGNCIVAGSIRRMKEEVKDIEIVLHVDPDKQDALATFLSEREHTIWHCVKGGSHYIQYDLLDQGIKLDLFMAHNVDSWGFTQVIRTGPYDFNIWLFTIRSKGGGMPDHLQAANARICHRTALGAGEVVPTPTEESVFDALGLKWIHPAARRPMWGRKDVLLEEK